MNERIQGPVRTIEPLPDASATAPAKVSRGAELQSGSKPVTQAGLDSSEKRLRLLVETGLLLTRERNPDVIVQAALDAGVQLCGASFGAFFYNNDGGSGETYRVYKLSGIDPAAFAHFPMPRQTAVFQQTFRGEAIVRSDDIQADPRYGANLPWQGMPAGHVPVRSYLAVPVRSPAGEILGAMLYAHPDPGVFEREAEDLVATVASQAAVAIANARLTEHLGQEIAAAGAARAEQRTAAERMQQVLESTSDGVALVDRAWRFTYVNRYANDLVAPGRQLIGTAFWDLFPNEQGGVFFLNYRRAMDHSETVEFTDFYPPLRRWVQWRVFPTPEGIAIFFRDVTGEREQAAELAEQARRLRQALDAAQMGTWTWCRQTDQLDLDERSRALLGIDTQEQPTRTELRQRVMARGDRELAHETLRHSIENGALYESEFRLQLPGGERRWLATSGIPNFESPAQGSGSEQAEIIGMIGVMQDVTARKTQEATLRESEKLAATGRMAATIAHEINNPLEAVTNLIYLAKTDPELPAHLVQLLETADSEVARVASIAQQTLGFYRDTSRPVVIDLNQLIAAVADLFSRKLATKQVGIEIDLDEGLSMRGLQGEIRQVVSNLLVNAIEASQEGTIRIRGRKRRKEGRECVSLIVSDQGAGIPFEVRQRLFTPFMTTKQSTGTGLGLWVTRGMVEKHGGTVSFRSSAEDGRAGTVFRVHLPVEHPGAQYFASPRAALLQ